MVVSFSLAAQTYTPEEKQKMADLGKQYASARDLYQALVTKAGGGRPMDPANVPDWSGVYTRTRGRTNFDPDQKPGELPTTKLTPAGQASLMKRIEMTKQGIQFDPISTCLSPGMPRRLDMPFLRDFVVTPKNTIMIAEAYNSVRRIYTDGRGHLPEEERFPTHNGDAIGIRDGNGLILHNNMLMAHYYERTQPDYTEQVETVEVWQKVDDNTLEADVWVYDPPVLAEPWYTKRAIRNWTTRRKFFASSTWIARAIRTTMST